ncbi:MAG TPA: SDR family oxidoreductase [Solirubrobacteraceae bacterium]|nr:SDR family oxidoreductase [Solirubrobacteraceae bacterium]
MSTECTRSAIVTGASSGIGAASALALAHQGCDVGITYNANADGAARTVEAIQATGRRAMMAQLDLAAPERAEDAIAELAQELGRLDVLVNNAGVNRRAEALEETVEGWNATLAVDLVAPWACAKAAANSMIAAGRGGRIINVSSILAFVPLAGGGAYCAAKAGLELLTKVLALEWATHGITVNSVAPGHTATPMNFEAGELDGSTIERPVIPLGRAAAAEEIAAAIAFLGSEQASYLTGACMLVDGGLALASGPQQLQQLIGLPPDEEVGK